MIRAQHEALYACLAEKYSSHRFTLYSLGDLSGEAYYSSNPGTTNHDSFCSELPELPFYSQVIKIEHLYVAMVLGQIDLSQREIILPYSRRSVRVLNEDREFNQLYSAAISRESNAIVIYVTGSPSSLAQELEQVIHEIEHLLKDRENDDLLNEDMWSNEDMPSNGGQPECQDFWCARSPQVRSSSLFGLPCLCQAESSSPLPPLDELPSPVSSRLSPWATFNTYPSISWDSESRTAGRPQLGHSLSASPFGWSPISTPPSSCPSSLTVAPSQISPPPLSPLSPDEDEDEGGIDDSDDDSDDECSPSKLRKTSGDAVFTHTRSPSITSPAPEMARVACPPPKPKPKPKPKPANAGAKRKRTSGTAARNPPPSATPAASLPAPSRRKVPLISSTSPYLPPRAETPDVEEKDVEMVEDDGDDDGSDDDDGDDEDDDEYIDAAPVPRTKRTKRTTAAAAPRTNSRRRAPPGRKLTKRGASGSSTAKGKDRGVTCAKCGVYCGRASDFPRHRVSCNGRDPEEVINTFRCPLCARLFNRHESARRHGRLTHKEVTEEIEYTVEPMKNRIFDILSEGQPSGSREGSEQKSSSKSQKKSKKKALKEDAPKEEVPKESRRTSKSRRAAAS